MTSRKTQPWPGDRVCMLRTTLATRLGTNEYLWIQGPAVGMVISTVVPTQTFYHETDTDMMSLDMYVILFDGLGIYTVPGLQLTWIH